MGRQSVPAGKVEQDYERWRREQPVALTEADRQEILTIAEDLPRVWQAPTTTAADRKQLVRFILKEVMLHQKREAGLLWMRISWQTGAITEHWMRRRVQDYRQYANLDRLEQRLRELNTKQKMDAEVAAILNAEGIRSAQGQLFKGPNIYLLRKRWHIPTVKINGTYQENPP